MQNIEKLVNISDFEEVAKTQLSAVALQYFHGAGGDEQTYEDNLKSFKRYRLRPKMLRNVSSINMTTSVLGRTIPFPICGAPVGLLKLAHPQGEIAAAKAIESLGTGLALSIWTTTSMSDVAREIPNSPKWFQLQFLRNRTVMKELAEEAKKCGFDGVFLTIDQPLVATRYAEARDHFSLPEGIRFPHVPQDKHEDRSVEFANNTLDPTFDWSDLKWFRGITSLPIALKGVLDGETARKASELGIDGVIVSNHGGRQLDGVPATIDVLREVVSALKDTKCEVYFDGGIRNGTDVLKAIAFGAKAVFVGRPMIWGLTCNEEGLKRIFTILKNELKVAMQLMGFTSIDEIQNATDIVVPQSYFGI